MIKYIVGDILDAKENIICHQCNVEGIFGGGLAFEIKRKYPNCETDAMNHVKSLKNKCDIIGTYSIYKTKKYDICNCFTQHKNFNTDYNAVKIVFESILTYCKETNKTIAIPYKYGCGIAKGDWNILENIFKKLSKKYEVDINVYKLEDKNNESININR